MSVVGLLCGSETGVIRKAREGDLELATCDFQEVRYDAADGIGK